MHRLNDLLVGGYLVSVQNGYYWALYRELQWHLIQKNIYHAECTHDQIIKLY